MRLSFPDQSYVEVVKLAGDLVQLTIAAKDSQHKLTIQTVELSLQQFQELIKLT